MYVCIKGAKQIKYGNVDVWAVLFAFAGGANRRELERLLTEPNGGANKWQLCLRLLQTRDQNWTEAPRPEVFIITWNRPDSWH